MRIALALVAAALLAGCAHEHANPAQAHPELAVVRIAGAQLGAEPGCGFLISANGLLVTTSSLLSDSSALSVTLADGRTRLATFVVDDRDGDVAILKIQGTDYPFLSLHPDGFEPVMHLRLIRPASISYGIFDRWEDSGTAIGFTARATAADCGAPLLADDNSVIGVVRAPSPTPASPQLATPIWHVTRMVPAEVK